MPDGHLHIPTHRPNPLQTAIYQLQTQVDALVHPAGIRPRADNWDEVAAHVLQRLEREQAHRPADQALADLLAEILDYPDADGLRRGAELPTGADLLVTLRATAP